MGSWPEAAAFGATVLSLRMVWHLAEPNYPRNPSAPWWANSDHNRYRQLRSLLPQLLILVVATWTVAIVVRLSGYPY
jgi:hypothetical protein